MTRDDHEEWKMYAAAMLAGFYGGRLPEEPIVLDQDYLAADVEAIGKIADAMLRESRKRFRNIDG